MDAFMRYAKKPHVIEDIKGTFQCSAKFKYPKPSETQVRKYFDDEINHIISRFYTYLKDKENLVEKPDKEFEECNKNIDQSDIIMEFDTWLEMEENEFTYVEKDKPRPGFTVHSSQPTHSLSNYQPPYPNPLQTPNPKFIPTPYRIPQPPPQPPPTPEHKPQPTFLVEKPSPAIKSLAQPIYLPAPHYQPIRPQVIPHQRGEEKPLRTRVLEKMAEMLDCPERLNITKSELTILNNRK